MSSSGDGPAAAIAPRKDDGLVGGCLLPDRNVTADTLEDAYMRFIFHCNPALPRDCDKEALREAFRSPPKSAGKAFDTFSVFELVKKFYHKEIKTWTDLTIRLGVEPPDPSKDESSQKITQYGVRLKKWMNSLHVKSFFEYLMDMPNDYWTSIPNDPDPIGQPSRDGVALEDDMALRALLPHIRPKRGRKRPDETAETPVSAQRQRLSPGWGMDSAQPWAPRHGETPVSAHPDAPRSAHPGAGPNDGSHTPFSQWPTATSAITPTARNGFWDDSNEPRSAVTPSQPKAGRQRRGAKNVSSAWKVGGSESGGKTRGRPPINRTPIEGPGYAFQAWPPAQNQQGQTHTPTTQAAPPVSMGEAPVYPVSTQPPPVTQAAPVGHPPALDRTSSAPVYGAGQRSRSGSEGQRPARPNISLQVPQHPGGPVRLATPPPAVVVNGHAEPQPTTSEAARKNPQDGWHELAKEAVDHQYETSEWEGPNDGYPEASQVPQFYFEKVEERENVDDLLGFFYNTTQRGSWFDQHGNPDEHATMEESAAIVNATLESMIKTATSSKMFLLNLGALAGAQTLMTRRAKYYRLPDGEDCHNYKFEWEYRFGGFKGDFTMMQTVPWSMWKRPPPKKRADTEEDASVGPVDWKKKYNTLLKDFEDRGKELRRVKTQVVQSLREKNGY